MHRLVGAAIAALALAAGGSAMGAQDAAALKVGDRAPDFTLTGSDGKQYNLKDFAGKSAVVIAWYPRAFTGG